MITQLKTYLFLSFIFITPAFSSLIFGGSDSGSTEDKMNFPMFFDKAPGQTALSDSTIYISRDTGERSLQLTVKLVRNNAKKPDDWTNVTWMTPEEQKSARPFLPSLTPTKTADMLFEAFLDQFIEGTLDKEFHLTSDCRLHSTFANIASKVTPHIECMFEKIPDKEASEPATKRPKFTKEFLLDAQYRGLTVEFNAQKELFSKMMSEDITYSQFFLENGGFVHISLESFLTAEDVLTNDRLMEHAQRLPINGVEVLEKCQTWFEAICNAHFKKHVSDKGGETLYH